MKHCPTCNKTFVDDGLSYCIHDGTPLVGGQVSSDPELQVTKILSEAPPTAVVPPPATVDSWGVEPSQPKTPEPYGWANEAPPVWIPPQPPRPIIRQQQQQTMAVLSLIFGIAAITFGWICGGPFFAVLALILGTVALSQIKRNPLQYGGKPLALGGMITGGIVLLIHLVLLVFWLVFSMVGAAWS
jgi:hypothetical protein